MNNYHNFIQMQFPSLPVPRPHLPVGLVHVGGIELQTRSADETAPLPKPLLICRNRLFSLLSDSLLHHGPVCLVFTTEIHHDWAVL
jgi:hypothetical protein